MLLMMILSVMLVLHVNFGRMSAFEREFYHPNNMPERPLSAVFAANQTSENSVKNIFRDL